MASKWSLVTPSWPLRVRDTKMADFRISSEDAFYSDVLKHKIKEQPVGYDKNQNALKRKNLLKSIEPIVGRIQNKVRERIDADDVEHDSSFAVRKRSILNIEDLAGMIDQDTLKKYKSAMKLTRESKPSKSSVEPKTMAKNLRQKLYSKSNEEMSKWDDCVRFHRSARTVKLAMDDMEQQGNMINWIYSEDRKNDKKELSQCDDDVEGVKLTECETKVIECVKKLSPQERSLLHKLRLREALVERREKNRLIELQRRYDAKRHMIKKIKSKTYKKNLRREELKKITKEQQQIISENGLEVNAEEEEKKKIEEMELMRAGERAGLKHRGGSKWTKKLLIKAGSSKRLREALDEQLKISRQRTEMKIQHNSDDDDELKAEHCSPSDKSGKKETKVQESVSQRLENLNNPWLSETEKQNEIADLKQVSTDRYVVLKSVDNLSRKTPEISNEISKEALSRMEIPVIGEHNIDFVNSHKLNFATPDGLLKLNSKKETINSESLENGLEEPTESEDEQDDVMEAFADDDLFYEFDKEKEEIEKAEELKSVKPNESRWKSLPGWGTKWVDPKDSQPKKQATRVVASEKKIRPRIDKKAPRVITNRFALNREGSSLELAKYVPNKVPFGFGDNEQIYRGTFSQPLGPEWNTVRSHNRLNRERISTTSGTVIKPISQRYKKASEKLSKNENISKVVSELSPLISDKFRPLM